LLKGTSQLGALTAYALFLNQIVVDDATLDAVAPKAVAMPDRAGLTADPRPDVR